MNELYLAILVTGGLVLILGLFSNSIKNRAPVSIPLLALLLGVALGPSGLDLLDPARWGPRDIIVEEAARLTLAIGLMSIALRLPPRHFLDYRHPMAIILGLVMPLMWASTSLIVYIVLDVSLVFAFLVGGILTPTDPIVASSIVTSISAKKNLPDRIRHNLSAESGANDGLAYLFVLLPLLLIIDTTDSPLRHWLVSGVVWEVVGAGIVGGILGYTGGWLLEWAESNSFLEKTSFLAFTVALALLVLGTAKLLTMDAILAVFVAGIAFDNAVSGTERAEEAQIQETVNQFFTLPIFALLGLIIPTDEWLHLGWPGAILPIAILVLRRLPVVLALRQWMQPLNSMRDAVFLGWFGPIGVSALLYAMMAVRRTGDESVWTITSLVICASIFAHGITATPLTRWYAQYQNERE